MEVQFDELVKKLEGCWKKIPKHFKNGKTIRRTLQCCLFFYWTEKGFTAIADYFPPRVTDRPIDIIVLNPEDNKKIDLAICIDELVTLHAVKSLSAFDAREKVIFTTHSLKKKVDESRFFLKPDIKHFHLQEK